MTDDKHADIIRNFLSDCERELSKSDKWRKSRYKLKSTDNYGELLILALPPSGVMPKQGIDLRVQQDSSNFYIHVGDYTVLVDKEGVPADPRSYHGVLSFVVSSVLSMLDKT